MPRGGVQLQLERADPAASGHGQRLHGGQGERPGALDQQILVEAAQLALGLARRGAHPRGGALGAAQREVGEREAPEQVIPVAVCRQQAARRREAGLPQERGQRLELLRQDRGVHEKGLIAAAHDRAAGLPDRAGGEQDVGV